MYFLRRTTGFMQEKAETPDINEVSAILTTNLTTFVMPNNIAFRFDFS